MKRGFQGLALSGILVVGAGGAVTRGTVAAPRPVPVHDTGAPPGHTGAAGGPTCHVCHNDLELNEPEGRLELTGFPERFQPGHAYVVTVSLDSEGMVRAGFQASVSRGELHSLSGATVVMAPDSLDRPYVGHAAGHTYPDTSDRTRWMFEWVAPGGSSGPVQLDVAANSANGDNSPLGDFIYTAAREARPQD